MKEDYVEYLKASVAAGNDEIRQHRRCVEAQAVHIARLKAAMKKILSRIPDDQYLQTPEQQELAETILGALFPKAHEK